MGRDKCLVSLLGVGICVEQPHGPSLWTTGDLVKLRDLMQLSWVGLRSPIPNRLPGEAGATGPWMAL